MRKLDLSSVNWRDGMIVGRDHLEAQEMYHDEALRWTLRNLTPLYGVLPLGANQTPSLSLDVEIVNNTQLRVQITHCRALTAAGDIINIAPDSRGQPVVGLLEIDPRPQQTFPVYLVTTLDKAPCGKPDASGNPPHRISDYTVVLDENQIFSEGAALKVAQVDVAEFAAKVSEEFIPPCFTIDATNTLKALAEDIVNLVGESINGSTQALAKSPPTPGASSRSMAARGFLEMIVSGWSATYCAISEWDGIECPQFVGGVRSLLRIFSRSLTAFTPTKDALDQNLLQTGGLPQLAGGIDCHKAIANFTLERYKHTALGPQLRQARELLGTVEACLRWVADHEIEASEPGPDDQLLKITYRQQNYYQVQFGRIDNSLTPENQVLYFRDLTEHSMRAVLFVLRNNAPQGLDERNISLKGSVNDDRPLFCPDLRPDFKERSGLIYLLLEVEPNKRDVVEYISLRSTGLINLEELLANQGEDIRLFYL